ncbi:hypothetical protein SEA_PUPPER_30 [Gordonia phage Pupper]|uniref:Uncharacterized protein n=1 Tax=Gordonia phage Pupper TaxID=2571249 RepID=A0A4Y6EKF2_9CAUD|nr:hypothetical protein KHQ83_gp030 [Gordonia phage Pupper]QDF18517.1 hypothetical protein SEA_PUPPER_30 [Gordonia phage Pupper]QDF18750.1 hypothetical protein SEA_SCENTAE_30 [Gordonia phage SCentae]
MTAKHRHTLIHKIEPKGRGKSTPETRNKRDQTERDRDKARRQIKVGQLSEIDRLEPEAIAETMGISLARVLSDLDEMGIRKIPARQRAALLRAAGPR